MSFHRVLRNLLRLAGGRTVHGPAEDDRPELPTGAFPVSDSAPEAAPCHLGLVFALKIEAAALVDRLERVITTKGHGFSVCQGGFAGRNVAAVVSGPGRKAAAKATEALITGHRPHWILSTGFAGALDPRLRRHHILMVDHLVDTSGGQLGLDLKVDSASLADLPQVHVGRLLTADSVIRLPEEKKSLGRQYNALAVDMESFAVAEVCRRHQVRFLAVRVINDAADDELPPDVKHLLAQKTGVARLGAAVGSIWRRPSSFGDMLKLKKNAQQASDRLAKFLREMIEQL